MVLIQVEGRTLLQSDVGLRSIWPTGSKLKEVGGEWGGIRQVDSDRPVSGRGLAEPTPLMWQNHSSAWRLGGTFMRNGSEPLKA